MVVWAWSVSVGRGIRKGLQRTLRKLLSVTDTFIILIVVRFYEYIYMSKLSKLDPRIGPLA